MTKLNPKVHIDERVFQKIMHWCNKAGNYEVSGLGNVIYDEKTNVFLVNEAYLLEQENTGTTTDINDEAIGKLMFEHHKSKIKGDLNFWWHSHADMNVFWSGTDMATIEQLGKEGWFLSTVFNKREEMRSAYHMTDPVSVFVDELDTLILQSFGDKDLHNILAKIGLQVRPGKTGDLRWMVEPLLSEDDKKLWDEEYDKKVKVKVFVPRVYSPTGLLPANSVRPQHPVNDFDPDDYYNSYNNAMSKDKIELDDDDCFFPDFQPRNRFDMSKDDMDQLLEDVEDFIVMCPGSTREDVINMFESEYPNIAQIIHPDFKGLAKE